MRRCLFVLHRPLLIPGAQIEVISSRTSQENGYGGQGGNTHPRTRSGRTSRTCKTRRLVLLCIFMTRAGSKTCNIVGAWLVLARRQEIPNLRLTDLQSASAIADSQRRPDPAEVSTLACVDSRTFLSRLVDDQAALCCHN